MSFVKVATDFQMCIRDRFGLQYTDLIVVKESLLFYSAESGEFAGGEVPFRLFSDFSHYITSKWKKVIDYTVTVYFII